MASPLVPKVIWAERKDLLYVTICLQDASNVDVKIEEQRIAFSGVSENKQYAVTIDLQDKIKTEDSTFAAKPRAIELKLKKAEEGPYWNKLQSGKKTPMIEIDWAKWVDEDEQKDEGFGGVGSDFGMGGMGGMGGLGGMGGMGGMGGFPGMEGLGGLGGMEGLGGLGGLGGGEDEGPDSDDDEDPSGPPPLETGAPTMETDGSAPPQEPAPSV